DGDAGALDIEIVPAEQADEKPQQIRDQGGLLVGLEQHHRPCIARQPALRRPRARRKFRLHNVLLAPIDRDYVMSRPSAQSRNSSLIEVFARVFSSTRLTITAQ